MSIPAIGNAWDAKAYDEGQNFVWRFGNDVVELVAPQNGETILDLGSGTGHLAARIAEAGTRVVGIDGSAAMVAEACRLYPQIPFFHVDARTLGAVHALGPDATAAETLRDASFDAVFSNATLHWIDDQAAALRGVRRVLKVGGRFVAEMGGRGNVGYVHAAIAQARAALGYAPRASVLFFPSIAEYATLLEANGFEVATMQLFDRPTPLEGEHGLANWARVFARNEIDDIRADELPTFNAELERIGRPELYDGTRWVADYRRLRFTARALPNR